MHHTHNTHMSEDDSPPRLACGANILDAGVAPLRTSSWSVDRFPRSTARVGGRFVGGLARRAYSHIQ